MKYYALGRLKRGEMNKTEAAYELELEAMKIAGSVSWFRFEGIKLRLADNTFYTPDFFVMLSDGTLEVHEVKGGWVTDDGLVKWKVAADLYPFKFIMAFALPKRDGGGWKIKTYGKEESVAA